MNLVNRRSAATPVRRPTATDSVVPTRRLRWARESATDAEWATDSTANGDCTACKMTLTAVQSHDGTAERRSVSLSGLRVSKHT